MRKLRPTALAVALLAPSIVSSADYYQPSLIGFAQVDGYIEYDRPDFRKNGQKLQFEQDGKTLNVAIDEDLQGYSASMDTALVWVDRDTTINFNVDNGGKGLTFLRNDDDYEIQRDAHFAMVDASTSIGSQKVCVNFDLGGAPSQPTREMMRLSDFMVTITLS